MEKSDSFYLSNKPDQNQINFTILQRPQALTAVDKDQIEKINVKAWTPGSTAKQHFENLINSGDQAWNQWLDPQNSQTFIEYTLKQTEKIALRAYSLQSANDCPGRDPYSWVLKGKNSDSEKDWVNIHIVSGEVWHQRHQIKFYNIDENDSSAYFDIFRVEISSNRTNSLKDFKHVGTQLNEFVLYYDEQDDKTNVFDSTYPLKKQLGIEDINQFISLEQEFVEEIQVSYWSPGSTGKQHFENLLHTGIQPWNKWLDTESQQPWIQYTLNENVYVPILGYKMVSANDCPSRDPYDWKLSGLNSSNEWKLLHSVKGAIWQNRHQAKHFKIISEEQFKAFKLQIDQNRCMIEFGYKGIGTQLNYFNIYTRQF